MGCRPSSQREEWEELALVRVLYSTHFHFFSRHDLSTSQFWILLIYICLYHALNLACLVLSKGPFSRTHMIVDWLRILNFIPVVRIKPRLADPSFRAQRNHILAAVENFSNLLRIRYSSPLFRLRTANAVQVRNLFKLTSSKSSQK